MRRKGIRGDFDFAVLRRRRESADSDDNAVHAAKIADPWRTRADAVIMRERLPGGERRAILPNFGSAS